MREKDENMNDNREKAERLSDALGKLNESIVIEAENMRYPHEAEKIYLSARGERTESMENIGNINTKEAGGGKKGSGKKLWIPVVSAAACGALVLGTLFTGGGNVKPFEHAVYAETLAEAEYPQLIQYPEESVIYSNDEKDREYYDNWREQNQQRRAMGDELDKGSLKRFYELTSRTFLNDEGSNRIYSPVNVYMALAMLAEVTEGNSRKQILELAGFDTIEELRTQAAALWNACYRNDGATTSILANSLWLDGNGEFNSETINRLADDYFASVYRGSFASEETIAAIKDWINRQTEGLLESSVDSLEIPSDTIMALCSTICFHARWDMVFNEENNDIRTFHGTGGDSQSEFMNMEILFGGTYYWGEDYGAVALPFETGGRMWLILPDEGKSTGDVLNSGEYLDMISSGWSWENSKRVRVELSVPKFDVASDLDLVSGLKELGVTDIFDGRKADFSALSEDTEGMEVSQVKHAARVMIDEEGCTAAAFTIMLMAGGTAMLPDDEIDFVLDRPFLFVIMSDTEQVLFMGAVETGSYTN